jgi:hypothetical protein
MKWRLLISVLLISSSWAISGKQAVAQYVTIRCPDIASPGPQITLNNHGNWNWAIHGPSRMAVEARVLGNNETLHCVYNYPDGNVWVQTQLPQNHICQVVDDDRIALGILARGDVLVDRLGASCVPVGAGAPQSGNQSQEGVGQTLIAPNTVILAPPTPPPTLQLRQGGVIVPRN